MKMSVERILAIAFAVAAVLLILTCMVTWNNTQQLIDADARVRHTVEVLNQLQTAMGLFSDLETGTRGYAITGDKNYLEPSNAAKARITEELNHLEEITRDNDVQHQHSLALQKLKDQQVGSRDHVVRVVEEKGTNAAQKEVASGLGKKGMDEVRRVVGEMQSEEQRLLHERQQNSESQQQVAFWTMSLLIALVISLLVMSYFIVYLHLRNRRRIEREIRKNRTDLLEAQQIAHMGSWTLDAKGVVTWSPELYNIYRRDPSKGPPTYEEHQAYFSPEDWERIQTAVKNAFDTGTPYDIEVDGCRGGNEKFSIKASGRVDRDAKGKIIALHGTVQDITESRMALKREQEMTRKAQAAEQAKAQFLAVMSHEIRTPMNGVLGFADLLAQHPLPAEQMDYVHTIQESGRSLLRIINDILDYSRLESGNLEIEHTSFCPRRLVENIRTLLSSGARFRPIEFATEIEPTLPKILVGDAGRLRQVMINLVSNALKFTEKGSVTLGLRSIPAPTDDTRLWLEFYVRDTGIGIPSDKIRDVFMPFVQVDNTIARRYGGTGLGLSIADRLVSLMGGNLSVQSTPGQDTTFSFTVPVEPAPSGASLPEQQVAEHYDEHFAGYHPARILVAEDDPVNTKLILRMLEKLGYSPLHAKTGQEAVEIFSATHPDFILMDLHMPDMDGLTATRQIRHLEEEMDHGKHPVYIAAFTADVMPKERRQCFDYGMDDYLTKPLNQSALADAIRRATAI